MYHLYKDTRSFKNIVLGYNMPMITHVKCSHKSKYCQIMKQVYLILTVKHCCTPKIIIMLYVICQLCLNNIERYVILYIYICKERYRYGIYISLTLALVMFFLDLTPKKGNKSKQNENKQKNKIKKIK